MFVQGMRTCSVGVFFQMVAAGTGTRWLCPRSSQHVGILQGTLHFGSVGSTGFSGTKLPSQGRMKLQGKAGLESRVGEYRARFG